MTNPPSAPLSVIDICNLALAKLGEAPLLLLDPNGCPASRLCYLHYHPTRREVLVVNRWDFATTVATLHGNPPDATGYHNLVHTLPTDCLRVLEVNSPGWTLRGRSIFCPAATVRLRYIADVEDTTLFDPLFAEALATRLACKLCVPLTGSTTARQLLTEEYNRITLPSAAHFNAVQAHSNDEHPLHKLLNLSADRG